jgi:hypothetical protein
MALIAVVGVSVAAHAEVPIDLSVQFGTESESPESAVAVGFDTFCDNLIALPTKTDDQTALAAVCTATQTGDDVDTADVFTALSARSMSGETTVATRGATIDLGGTVRKRLASLLRSTKLKTAYASPVEYYVNGQWIPASWVTAADGAAPAEPEGLLSQRWGAFFDLGYTKAEQDEGATQAGFDSTATGLTGGADYRLRNNAFVGGALRYQSTDGDLKFDAGSTSGSDATLTAYGTFYPSPNLYLEGALIYSRGSYDLKRNISFSFGTPPTTVNTTAKSTTDVTRTGLSFDGGYSFDFRNGGTLNTRASLLYSRTEIDPFSEKGAGGYNLKVDGQTTTATTLNLTAQYTQAISTNFAIIVPEASGSVIKEFVTDRQKVRAYFAADPLQTWFTYQIEKRDDFYGNVALGSTFVFTSGRSAFVRYEQLVGFDNFSLYTVTLGGRMEF